jgi:hypothetical protein
LLGAVVELLQLLGEPVVVVGLEAATGVMHGRVEVVIPVVVFIVLKEEVMEREVMEQDCQASHQMGISHIL